jgi:hypothetical protein
LALLIMGAYIGATVLSAVPVANAANMDMSSNIAHAQPGPGDKAPCHGMTPGCVTELGCVFLISVLPPVSTISTATAWAAVTYAILPESLRGRSTEPDLGPPISRA